MKRKLLILLALLFISSFTYAQQYTSIPDINFENKLIQLRLDSGLPDGKVLTNNIRTVQTLEISYSNISDLTGLEDFTELQVLRCTSNNLTRLDASKNSKLTVIDCGFNKLTYLNISNLLLLNALTCSDNLLTELDISKNPILNGIRCGNNNLISLNLKNGYNSKFNDYFISFKNNPHLSCIEVDNISYSNSKWSNYKDDTAVYSNTCGLKYTTITDSNFENKLISLGIDTDGLNGKVLTSNIVSLATLNISNSSIQNLKGIEDFLSLTNLNVSGNTIAQLDLTWQKQLKILNCSNNQLTGLDLSKNTKLETLDFSNNKITTTNLWNNSLLVSLKANSNLLNTLDIDGLKALQSIDITDNQLTALNLTQNTLLTQLKSGNNKITSLNTSKNTKLVSLFCGSNKLTSLDISSNSVLTEISCENNLLSTLNLKNGNNTNFTTYDFRNNPNMPCIEVDNASYSLANWSSKKDAATTYNVYCGPFTTIPDSNFEDKLIALGIDLDGKNGKIVTAFISNLTNIDLSNSSIIDLTGIQDFTALTNLTISGNQIVNLDLSNNKNLKVLNCSNNQLASLDVSKNTLLTDFYCNNNLLKTLNIKNGKNTRLVNFDFRNNPNLSCIEVDVVSYATTNWSAKKDAASTFEFICGEYTLLSDYNFETYLINKKIDIDGRNGKVLTSSIKDVTTLDLTNYSISNLKGLQDFKSLVTLNVSNSQITNLDVSKNPELENLNCSGTNITTLDLSNNLKLVSLNCSKNKLTTLDVASHPMLQSLDFSNNSITTLDLSKNTLLKSLICYSNKLTALEFSQNPSITNLLCYENQITSLNVSNLSGLVNLNCGTNKLTSLDVTKNIALTDFDCSTNKILELDLSQNSLLVNISCSNNGPLAKLNLKNGNNVNINRLFISNNPKLYCIQVDNEEFFYTKFKNTKDSGANYSENCDQYTLIPDSNFEDNLIANGVDIDGKNGKVQTFRIIRRTGIYLSGYNVSDLTGIEDFTNLETLQIESSALSSLNLSKNKKLVTLRIGANALTSLDLTNNVLLKEVYCQKNQITDLDISNCKLLTKLDCSDNKLKSLNVANGNYKNLSGINNKSDFRRNPDLTCIFVDDVDYCMTNWFDIKDPKAVYSRSCGEYVALTDSNFEAKLIQLGIDKDGINGQVLKSDVAAVTDLDISGSAIVNVSGLEYFTALKTLNCSNNNITVLNINKNAVLTSLNCSNTKIKDLDVTSNKLLTSLNTSNGQLTYLGLKNGNNNKIQTINLKNNPALSCIEVDDVTYSNTNWSSSKDAAAQFLNSCGIYTSIPDDNFEYMLISLRIDKDGKNNRVLTSDIANLITLNVNDGQISDLTGIQNFKSLQNLYFNRNVVTSVDLSKNLELTTILFDENAISTIDFSANKKLVSIDCGSNKFTSINVEMLPALKTLVCDKNNLTEINVTKNPLLQGLSFYQNNLTTIDLSKNTDLRNIYGYDNKLTSLDLSKCVSISTIDLHNNQLTSPVFLFSKMAPITSIDISHNQLTDLDLSGYSKLTKIDCDYNQLVQLKVSKNPLLKEMRCGYNQLTTLDITEDKKLEELFCANNKLVTLTLSQNESLKALYCQENSITSLDFRSVTALTDLYAFNNKLQTLNLDYTFYDTTLHGDITNNPDLTCITVKKGSSRPQTWQIKKDNIATYATDCISVTTITDPNFEDFLIKAGIDKDGKNGKVLTAFIGDVKTLDVSNLGITDLKGIEGFTSIQKIICSGNEITSLDLSSNLSLTYLDCSNNPLTNLNLTNNAYLRELYCNDNVNITKKSNAAKSNLTSLNLDYNIYLTNLDCSNNQIISLDLSKNTQLTNLNCSNNSLKNLNLKNGNNTALVSINLKNNASLSCINVDNATFSNANWSAAKDTAAQYSATCSALTVEESAWNKINIYPNPTKGELNINNVLLEKVNLYNTLGELVKTITFASGSNTNALDLKGLPTGVYYLFIETAFGHTTKKIIIQ